jgi:hypothetical protein
MAEEELVDLGRRGDMRLADELKDLPVSRLHLARNWFKRGTQLSPVRERLDGPVAGDVSLNLVYRIRRFAFAQGFCQRCSASGCLR